jgi:hypothetical protein
VLQKTAGVELDKVLASHALVFSRGMVVVLETIIFMSGEYKEYVRWESTKKKDHNDYIRWESKSTPGSR